MSAAAGIALLGTMCGGSAVATGFSLECGWDWRTIICKCASAAQGHVHIISDFSFSRFPSGSFWALLSPVVDPFLRLGVKSFATSRGCVWLVRLSCPPIPGFLDICAVSALSFVFGQLVGDVLQ